MTATFTECPSEVLYIAQDLIKDYHPTLAACRIGFVMRSEAGTSGGNTVRAQTSKIPEKLKPHLQDELDILIVIAEDVWSHLGHAQRVALIDHELCHIVPSSAGWTTQGHDIEEFKAIIDRHGLWNMDLFGAKSTLAKASEGGQLDLFTSDRPAGKLVSVEVKSFGLPGEKSDDDLLQDVLEYAKTVEGQLTTSQIQRRFKIGYSRAARLMELVQAANYLKEAGAELVSVETVEE